MAREPHYPKDASVTPAKGTPTPAETPAAPPKPEPESDGKSADSKRKKHLMAGAAIGIGSAAIVAALLYANRRRDRT